MPDLNREKALFAQALDCRSPEEQEAFLSLACGQDADLRRRIEALLKASATAPGFLPAAPAMPDAAPPLSGIVEGPGTTIGNYRLLERIGEGGFGLVYMAEQLHPVRRRVALKIIKPGMDSRQVIGRFEIERQALALMEHPNIAQVFEAGTTDTGRPYFVMELVRGIPITRFCDESQLGIEARLRLFIEVCSAVQHAHQKGVIHRDLKPSNILVALHGDRPVPKVIDFGIAKAIAQPLTDKTVFTQFQQLLGTPAYMSPEQAALSGLETDTRSDIYSLGVLLYELLTSVPPFDTQELLRAGLDTLRKTICEREPERPSTRLRRLLAHGSPTPSPARCAIRIPRELDLIVLKTLEKDRDRRYATANGLAADLQRYLNDEPVTAVAASLGYQLVKLYRRHRGAALAACACAGMLVAATAVSLGFALRSRQAETLAARNAVVTDLISDFLWRELLKPLTPWDHTNRMVSLREAFDLSASGIAPRLDHEPLAEAGVRLAYGQAYIGLSEWAAAESNLVRALTLYRTHEREPGLRTALAAYQLGVLREFQEADNAAEALFEEAASLRAKVLSPLHRDALGAAAKVTILQARRLPPAEAEARLRQSATLLQRHLGDDHHLTLATLNHLGFLLLHQGRVEEAFEHFSQTHRMATLHHGEASGNALWSLELMASARIRQNRLAEADDLYRNLIATRERLNGPRHFFTLGARVHHASDVLIPQGRFAEAATTLSEIAAEVRSSQPVLVTSITHATRTLLDRWHAAGGGPEFERFVQWTTASPIPPASTAPPPASEHP